MDYDVASEHDKMNVLVSETAWRLTPLVSPSPRPGRRNDPTRVLGSLIRLDRETIGFPGLSTRLTRSIGTFSFLPEESLRWYLILSHGSSMTTRSSASSQEPTDASLVQQVRSGSEEAAAQLYRRYVKRLRSLVRTHHHGRLRQRLDGEDIVQSVFGRFFQAVRSDTYHAPRDDELWNLLLVIAKNRIRTQAAYHHAQRRDVRQTETEPQANDETATETHDTIGHLIFQEMLETLSLQQRQALQLRLDGCRVAEIAQHMGRSKRTIERLLQECRYAFQRLQEA